MARNAGFAGAFPDRKVEIEDLIAADDRVGARAVMHVIHTGPLGDIAPTGQKVRFASTIIYRFEEGRSSKSGRFSTSWTCTSRSASRRHRIRSTAPPSL
jgi:predicted ester cyclase